MHDQTADTMSLEQTQIKNRLVEGFSARVRALLYYQCHKQILFFHQPMMPVIECGRHLQEGTNEELADYLCNVLTALVPIPYTEASLSESYQQRYRFIKQARFLKHIMEDMRPVIYQDLLEFIRRTDQIIHSIWSQSEEMTVFLLTLEAEHQVIRQQIGDLMDSFWQKFMNFFEQASQYLKGQSSNRKRNLKLHQDILDPTLEYLEWQFSKGEEDSDTTECLKPQSSQGEEDHTECLKYQSSSQEEVGNQVGI